MSYILDALNRADTERERGAAPGLHTRHQVPVDSPASPGANRLLWLAVAGSVAVLLLVSGFWFWQPPVLKQSAAPLPPTPVTRSVAAPVDTPPLAIPPLIPPPDPGAEAPGARPQPARATSAPANAAVPAPIPATLASLAVSAPAALPMLAELPPDLRNQIPKITITGSVYSDSPAQRLLLVNNLVLAQGAQVAPDLKLEEIQPRSSVLSFKGNRFRVMH